MDGDPLDYPRLVRDVFVGVARHGLQVAAEQGFPGELYFYLSFRTTDRDLVMSRTCGPSVSAEPPT
jgi:hypothetical protein